MRRRFFSFRLPRRRWQAFFLVVLLLALAALRQWGPELFRPETIAPASRTSWVVRVVDGDTLVLAGLKPSVRLIGADTPETVKPNTPVEPFGPEARQFTEQFIAEANGEVRLQFDRDRVDRYERFLAYVWSDGEMLNEELIRAGLAEAALQYRYASTMKTRFRRAEEEAKAAGRGIWSLQPASRP